MADPSKAEGLCAELFIPDHFVRKNKYVFIMKR